MGVMGLFLDLNQSQLDLLKNFALFLLSNILLNILLNISDISKLSNSKQLLW
ncbi:hypothetical protein Pse7367_0839 [Thalassoporum mexicanum PCC 7367]|nr:hypothetical protein Pse7367_0839 [Pseudanabaena sp. PCC 7367]